MFAKLRTAKYMKTQISPNEAVIEFAGNVQRMARVHHYGLRDRLPRAKKDVKYEERPLLGVNKSDIEVMRLIITNLLNE